MVSRVLLVAVLVLVGGACEIKPDGRPAMGSDGAGTTADDDSNGGVPATGTAGAGSTSTGSTGSSGVGSTDESTSGGPAPPVLCGDVLCDAGSICVHSGADCVLGEPDTGEMCESIPPDNTCDEIVYPPPSCAVDPCTGEEDQVWCLVQKFCQASCSPEFSEFKSGQLYCAAKFCHCGAF